jgi:hypothetical protein
MAAGWLPGSSGRLRAYTGVLTAVLGTAGWGVEAFRWLVPLPVFKTGVARYPGQAGSIPVRLRQSEEPDARRSISESTRWGR